MHECGRPPPSSSCGQPGRCLSWRGVAQGSWTDGACQHDHVALTALWQSVRMVVPLCVCRNLGAPSCSSGCRPGCKRASLHGTCTRHLTLRAANRSAILPPNRTLQQVHWAATSPATASNECRSRPAAAMQSGSGELTRCSRKLLMLICAIAQSNCRAMPIAAMLAALLSACRPVAQSSCTLLLLSPAAPATAPHRTRSSMRISCTLHTHHDAGMCAESATMSASGGTRGRRSVSPPPLSSPLSRLFRPSLGELDTPDRPFTAAERREGTQREARTHTHHSKKVHTTHRQRHHCDHIYCIDTQLIQA